MTFVDDAIKSHDVCVNSYFFYQYEKVEPGRDLYFIKL